jgi:hypothetical protein
MGRSQSSPQDADESDQGARRGGETGAPSEPSIGTGPASVDRTGPVTSSSLAFLHALAHVSDRTPQEPAGGLDEPGARLGAAGDPERFELHRCLGRGGFGTVYEAFDRARGATVALKVLRRQGGQALLLFKQEFRGLAGIAHPNLVQLYELHGDQDRWFFTMELVDGRDALTAVRSSSAAAGLPFDEARLRALCEQLVLGLFFLHEAGKLHRDVKPSNVLVDARGQVKILDFGLIVDLAGRPLAEVAGTPHYMAPEQAAALPIGPAADWYAVGVILYQALTGRLPIRGPEGVPRPSELVPGVPADLEALCQGLLAEDPAQRPTGADLRAALALREHRGVAPKGGAGFQAGLRFTAAPFIGRAPSLRRLEEALAAARAGRPVVAMVHGSSGIGKGALVQRFLEMNGDDDLARSCGAASEQRSRSDVAPCLALAGRCFEQEAVPYKGVDSLMDALCRRLSAARPADVEAMLPPDAGVLGRLFPVLRQLPGVREASRDRDGAADDIELRRRAFTALRELLARLGRGRTVVLFIDDLPWGDLDSVALLLEILRPPGAPPLLLVVSYRTEDAATSPVLGAFRDGLGALGDAIDLHDIPVGELDAAEAEELARALLEEAKMPAPEGAARAIAAEGRGNALFISELARWAKDTGGEGASAARALSPSAPRLEALLEARIGQLPEPARQLLEVVVVAGHPLARPSAASAALGDQRGADEPQALALLRAGQLLRVRQERGHEELVPYHERIREVALRRLSPDVRKDYHRRLARSLEASGEPEPEQLLLHLRQAGLTTEAGRWAERAAAEAHEALAFDRAARLYREAIELKAEGGADQGALFGHLASALTFAGRPRDAAEAHLSAAARATPAAALSHRRQAMEKLLTGGYTDEGLAVLGRLLRDIGVDAPSSRAGALLSFASIRWKLRARGLGFRERAEQAIPERELLAVDACWSAAAGLTIVDPLRGAALQARHLLLALSVGEPLRVARALFVEAIQSALLGGWLTRQPPSALLTRAAAMAAPSGRREVLGLEALLHGLVAGVRGQLEQAEPFLRESMRLLGEPSIAGAWWQLDLAWSLLSRCLWMRGEIRSIGALLPGLVADARERGNRFGETMLRLSGGVLLSLADDRVEEARDTVRTAEARWRRGGYDMQRSRALLATARIALYNGEGGAAYQTLAAAWPALLWSGLLAMQPIRLEVTCSRGLSALAAADEAKAGEARRLLGVAARDARALRRVPNLAWGRPAAALMQAGVAARGGRLEQALELALEAERGLDATGYALWAAAVRRQRGAWLGGDEGQRLVAAADAWMIERGIRRPARLAVMLTGGGPGR